MNARKEHYLARNELMDRRMFILGGMQLSCFGILFGRLIYLQIIQGSEYKVLSEKNRISRIAIYPHRGNILDCNNNIIACNYKCLSLVVNRMLFLKQDPVQRQLLFNLLLLTDNQKILLEKRIRNAKNSDNVVLIPKMTWTEVISIEENIWRFRGVYIENGNMRKYMYGEVLAHITGYISAMGPKEKARIVGVSNLNVGKSGLEKYYEDVLSGHFGYRRVEVNATGKIIRELDAISPIHGENISTYIDIELQEYVANLTKDMNCVVIAMDVKTGAIPCMFVYPTYDPNHFTKAIIQNDRKKSSINEALLNRAIQSSYAPGSIFKLITTLAALESGVSVNTSHMCSGQPLLHNHFRCWKEGGHGVIRNMQDAIKLSCNHYVFHLASIIGYEAIYRTAEKLGFGKITGIDLPYETFGRLPTPDWKKLRYKDTWRIGDTYNCSIGQGYITATPIQLLTSATALINGGILLNPKVQSEVFAINAGSIASNDHLEIIKEATYRVVNEPYGTAYRVRIPEEIYKFGGKTSTAQLISKSNNKILKYRNNAMFFGYGPFHDPKYSVLVIVENGGSGSAAAAPIAKEILLKLMSKYS